MDTMTEMTQTTHSQKPTQTTEDRQRRMLHVYAIAGIATSPDFMEGLLLEIERRLAAHGVPADAVRTSLLLPYGSWNRPLWLQLREIGRDLRLGPGRRSGSVGGAAVLRRLAADGVRGDDALWLIGHSGGGLAAVHAAEELLAQHREPDLHTVQVGSPRCAVAAALQARAAYVYAAGPGGRGKDPICRLGRWGWRRRRVPSLVAGVPIVGGHADYFREHPPYVQPETGAANLDLTLGAFWNWLIERSSLPMY
jgi:hypothetical protein